MVSNFEDLILEDEEYVLNLLYHLALAEASISDDLCKMEKEDVH